jgi:hypothetical protein
LGSGHDGDRVSVVPIRTLQEIGLGPDDDRAAALRRVSSSARRDLGIPGAGSRYRACSLRRSWTTGKPSGIVSPPVNIPVITRPRTCPRGPLGGVPEGVVHRSATAPCCRCAVCHCPTVFSFVTDIDLRGPLGVAPRDALHRAYRTPRPSHHAVTGAGCVLQNAKRSPSSTMRRRSPETTGAPSVPPSCSASGCRHARD